MRHYIYWFRKDLRIDDNKGLNEFLKSISGGDKFSFLYIKNKNSYKYFGEKRIAFLYESLIELGEEFSKSGFTLQIAEGRSPEVFKQIIQTHKNVTVVCTEQVEPYCTGRDNEVKDLLEVSGNKFIIYTDSTIFKPGQILNGEGRQYKVYTPFKNQCLNQMTENDYKSYKTDLSSLQNKDEYLLKGIKEFDIKKDYKSKSKSELLRGGRREGIKLLKLFYEKGISEYKSGRDFPFINGTSLLSGHLHFGTVGIREAYRTGIVKLNKTKENVIRQEIQTWLNELLWREFYYHITFFNPHIYCESFKKEYDNIRWNYDNSIFEKWCSGKTGFPIVDAGMRQLNSEGWLHNRVRMIVAMFLTKDLLIDWRSGERYFAEKLIDLDFSSNNGGWQWSASTGVDAQPYFRIFNPYLQSKKFDAEGNYIKKYLPELNSLPVKYIHEPNLMTPEEQKEYGVIIGKDYPDPLVNHQDAREEVLKRFKEAITKNQYK